MGAVRDYCLFIRGLSFGEFSGCAYLRNDDNPLSLFFASSHQERGLFPRRKARETGRRYVRVTLFTILTSRCDEDHPCTKKKKRQKELKKEKERTFEQKFHLSVSLCAPQASFVLRVISGGISEDS